MIPFPDKKYRTLVIDPPWRQSFDYSYGRPKPGKRYDQMSLEEIKSLPIDDCLLPSAVVFLWATQPTLKAAFDVVAAWGLKYRLLMTWNKVRVCGHAHGGIPTGYPRYNTEFVLVCTKGGGQVSEHTRPQGRLHGHCRAPFPEARRVLPDDTESDSTAPPGYV